VTAGQPSIFVSYRRTDEPFAAALTASQAGALVGDADVFLDTLYLRQRGPFERELLSAIRGSRLVLAVIGAAWDRPANLDRLADPQDWVRRELEEATAASIPIVPVLVARTGVPVLPGLDVVFSAARALVIDREDTERLADDLGRLLGTGSPTAGSDSGLVERAVLAMLRHVLPTGQRSMSNDRTVAGCVAGRLQEGEWLRFVFTGNLPGKPNGSTVVYLTPHRVGIAQLSEDLTRTPVDSLPTAGLEVRRSDRHRLWRAVADLELVSGRRSVHVRGVFAEEADELIEMLDG
jgi:hypothetical protein